MLSAYFNRSTVDVFMFSPQIAVRDKVVRREKEEGE
jgi:hypothetical protein